jgi:hypothetical protein
MKFLLPLIFIIIPKLILGQLDSFPRISEVSGYIIVEKNDSIIFQNQYGKLSFENDLDLTDSTYFNVGHFGSLFTYQIIDSLISHNILHPDQKVCKYIPAFSNKKITVSNLIAHTSGIANNYLNLFHRDIYRKANSRNLPESIQNSHIYELIQNHFDSTEFKPLVIPEFSSINMILLGFLAEITTGQSLEQLCQLYCENVILNPPNSSIGIQYSSGHHFSDSLNIQSMNDISDLGIPYRDITYGHVGYFCPINEINFLLKGKHKTRIVPLIHGEPGYHIEIYDKKGATVYLFLNMISEQENLESDLKAWVNHHVLPE